MTLPGSTAGRFDAHYTAPSACANKEILGVFRAGEGSLGLQWAIQDQCQASGGGFAGIEARPAWTVHRACRPGNPGREHY